MIAEPIKIMSPPNTKEALKVIRKKRALNRTTKKGYIISMIDAEGAPTSFIPDKIRKLAIPAKVMERMTNNKFVLPEESIDFTEFCSIKMKGKTIIAVINELTKSNVIGEVFKRIF